MVGDGVVWQAVLAFFFRHAVFQTCGVPSKLSMLKSWLIFCFNDLKKHSNIYYYIAILRFYFFLYYCTILLFTLLFYYYIAILLFYYFTMLLCYYVPVSSKRTSLTLGLHNKSHMSQVMNVSSLGDGIAVLNPLILMKHDEQISMAIGGHWFLWSTYWWLISCWYHVDIMFPMCFFNG